MRNNSSDHLTDKTIPIFLFKLFFVRFRRRDSYQNSIESWLQAQIWLHESALWFIFNSVNVKSISWVVCFCSSSLSDWSSNSQTLKCKTQLSDNPVAVVSSCTGTQKKETLTNCVITPCMVMKTKGIPSCTGTLGQPPGCYCLWSLQSSLLAICSLLDPL